MEKIRGKLFKLKACRFGSGQKGIERTGCIVEAPENKITDER